MNYEKYELASKEGKSNCVVRSLCKILDKEYAEVYGDLCNEAEKLKCSSFNDIIVFESYMKNNNIFKIYYQKDTKLEEIKFDDGYYIIFCWDKNEYYHMIPVINNTVYDKNQNYLNLYLLSLYKKNY